MRKCIIPHKKSGAWVAPSVMVNGSVMPKEVQRQPIIQKLEDNMSSWFRQPNGDWYFIPRWRTQRVNTSKGED